MKKNKLGLTSAISVSLGLLIATNILVSLCQGVGFGGRGFIIALGIAFILNLFVCCTFSELNAFMPVTGGLAQYTLPALGPFVGIITVLSGYVVCNIFAASVEASMSGIVINSVFLPQIDPRLISCVTILILWIINLFGTKSFARVQIITIIILISALIIFALAGAFKFGVTPAIDLNRQSFIPTTNIAPLIAIAFWLFVGSEYVTPLTKDLKDPKCTVPLGMILGLSIAFIIHIVMCFAISNYVEPSILQTSLDPHIILSQNLFGNMGMVFMALISVCAVITTFNTVLISISNMCYGMAKNGLLPNIFSKTNRFGAPYIGLTFNMLTYLIVVVMGITSSTHLTIYILTGSLFWMLAYVVAHITVLILRKKYPTRLKGFKLHFKGIPQILGILGNIYIIFNIAPDHSMRLTIFKTAAIWLIFICSFAAIWVKKVMKKRLFETIPIEEVMEMNLDAPLSTQTLPSHILPNVLPTPSLIQKESQETV